MPGNNTSGVWNPLLSKYVLPDNEPIKTANDRQSYFLTRAMNVAQRSSCKQHKHGCVIVKNNEIIAEGFNHTNTHLYHKFSIHAEVDALSKLPHNKKYMADCEMYVVRINSCFTNSSKNWLKFSRPCDGCSKAIQKSGLKKVYYSTNNDCISSTSISSKSSCSSSDDSMFSSL